MSDFEATMSQVRRLHTLGPTGTNCERAAHEWLRRRGVEAPDVVLHRTLEEAIGHVDDPSEALLGCVVYPALHGIVFNNLHKLVLTDCLIIPTDEMLLASRPGTPLSDVKTAGSHPAPVSLLDAFGVTTTLCNSNAEAAIRCASGEFDACITTRTAAQAHGLEVLRSFGTVSMGFSIHCLRGDA